MPLGRDFARALLPAVAALAATACGVEPRAQRYVLEPAAEAFLDYEPCELDPQDTLRWLDDGRLFLETVSIYGPYRHVKQLWIAFAPGAPAHVEVRSWSEESSSSACWPRTDIVGRAWVSSDGRDLRDAGGPDLIIDIQWTAMISGSDQRSGQRLRVRSDQLAREPR